MNRMTTDATDGTGTDRTGMTLEARLRALDPDLHPPVLDGGDLRYVVEPTRIGPLLLAVRADGRLVASTFVAADGAEDAALDRLARTVSPRVLRGGRLLDEPRRELEEYLAGRRRRFDLAVDPVLATPFQRVVLAGLGEVGYGQRVSYGSLAAAIGRPSAARAVGTALGANPLCVVLPCHRVVASSGALTGYAGGLDAKRLLLDLETSSAA
jgi:methylated-DNA-[protein]-cysteine S-methyltransferase